MATFGDLSWGAAGVGNGPNFGRWARMAELTPVVEPHPGVSPCNGTGNIDDMGQ